MIRKTGAMTATMRSNMSMRADAKPRIIKARIALTSSEEKAHGEETQEERAARGVQADQPRHQAQRPDRDGAGVQRLRLLGPEHLSGAEMVGRARRRQELRAPGPRSGRAHRRRGLVALAGGQHSPDHKRAEKGRRPRRRHEPPLRL